MADTQTDDAPVSSSKSSHAAADASDLLIENSGASIFGRAVTINKPAAELFAFWRDFGNLATFMDNVVAIDAIDHMRSRWTVKAPAGKTVSWTARVTGEEKDRFIAWASEDDADVPNSGKVQFREAGDRGTVVTATIVYDPPAGVIGKVVAKLFQREPAVQARRDLRRLKQLMETGEIATGAHTAAQRQNREG